MTLGEKLKEARKTLGLSQEQLAQKLCVSRQAITKWETGKGTPDVENLRAISAILNISIDYLLDDSESMNKIIIKESINLDNFKISGRCRCKQDAVVIEKYPDAEMIYPLNRNRKLNKVEWVLDFITLPGIFDIAYQFNDKNEYYLVEVKDKQFFVSVSKNFIESTELSKKITDNKFIIGDIKFYKAPYKLMV